MGKIRVKTLGIEEVEKQQKKEAKKRHEKKKTAKVPGLKREQRVVAVGPTEEELARLQMPSQSDGGQARLESGSGVIAIRQLAEKQSQKDKKDNKEKFQKTTQHTRSKKYQAVAKLVDKTKTYPLQEALTLLPKLHLSSFDETVELHINTKELGITATATLPHGTGKKVRVAIANPTAGSGQAKLDELITKIGSGNIDFDVLLVTPDAMPKLARVAKFLGPKGLMPNPKNGTITTNPKELAKKFEKGQVTFKTESKSPIIHISVGKLSIGAEKLLDNIQTVLNAVKPQNIKNATLKSTMSPGIRIQLV